MRNILQSSSLSFSHLLCSTFNHDYIVTNIITDDIKEYKCANCGREVTDNFSGNLELLTPRKKLANKALSLFHSKKKQRLTAG